MRTPPLPLHPNTHSSPTQPAPPSLSTTHAPTPTAYLRPPSALPLSCCAFGPTGRLIAVGEGGRGGGVHIYDVVTLERVGGSGGIGSGGGLHEYGVRCVRWNKAVEGMLVSVGEPMVADEVGTGSVTSVCFTDWRTDDRDSAVVHVLYESVTAADCSEDGSSVVLCGDKGLTLLNLRLDNDDSRSLGAFNGRRLTVETQEVKLGPVHKSATFTSVVCGLANTTSYVFALTNKGVLCAFTQKDRKKAQSANTAAASPNSPTNQRWSWEIEKWVDLRLETGYCLAIAASATSEHKALLAIGGAEGKVRLFEPEKLAHVATFHDLLHSSTPPHICRRNSRPSRHRLQVRILQCWQ